MLAAASLYRQAQVCNELDFWRYAVRSAKAHQSTLA